MNLLVKNILIIYPKSKYDTQILDILIENGKITKIGNSINSKDAAVIDGTGAFVAPGFIDTGAQVCDPGFEHREDIYSAAAAASFGGFTSVAVQPNTLPVLHSKSEILYLKNKAASSLVDFLPIGALSQDCKGENISEMHDMHEAGAVAFSDGSKSVKDSGLMLRALQYVKAFGGLIINHPFEKSVASGGQMHEGVMSTTLGMKGIPSLSEEMMLTRDLYLVEYADSQLHIQNISTARSVDLVREAKQKGLKITASVAAINLAFEDTALENFDTFLKVQPPLRSRKDIEALQKGLQDGTIDIINSNHVPHDEEAWNLEFPYASFGVLGLETAVSVANTFGNLSPEQLVEKFAIAPRKILNINILPFEEGEMANLTFFHPTKSFTYSSSDIFSKSKNTPFVGKTLVGKTLAVVNKGKMKVIG